MSAIRICDFCGATKWDSFIEEQNAWIHFYNTGKDMCPRCIEKEQREKVDALFKPSPSIGSG